MAVLVRGRRRAFLAMVLAGIGFALLPLWPTVAAPLGNTELLASRSTATGDTELVKLGTSGGTQTPVACHIPLNARRIRLSPNRQKLLYYYGPEDNPQRVSLYMTDYEIPGYSCATHPTRPQEPLHGWPVNGVDPVRSTLVVRSWMGHVDPDPLAVFKAHADAEWAPNGTHIVFSGTKTTDTHLQLYLQTVLPSVGSASKLSFDTNVDHLTPSYWKDGGSILYSRCNTGTSPCTHEQLDIYLMPVANPALDYRLTQDSAGDVAPHVSDDLQYIEFTRVVSCLPKIYRIPGPTQIPPIVQTTATDISLDSFPPSSAQWDRRLNTLYYARMPVGTTWSLARINVPTPIGAGTSPTTFTNPSGHCAREMVDLTQNSNSALSSGGKIDINRMVWSASGPNHRWNELYIGNKDGSGTPAPTRFTDFAAENPGGGTPEGAWWARMNPNRDAVVFYRGPVDSGYENNALWIKDWNYTTNTWNTARVLIPAAGPAEDAADPWVIQGHAAWSPDGNWLTMFVLTRTQMQNFKQLQIWIVHKDGTQSSQLTGFVGSSPMDRAHLDPSFAADGGSILYSRCPDTVATNACGANTLEIHRVSILGENNDPDPWTYDVRLTNDSSRDHDAYMSPDGTKIAFLRQISCTAWGVWVMPAAFSVQTTTQLTPSDGKVWSLPNWSRDSTQIFTHQLPANAKSEIVKMTHTGGSKTVIGTATCGIRDPHQSSPGGV